MSSTFKSYVDLNDHESSRYGDDNISEDARLMPTLLPGMQSCKPSYSGSNVALLMQLIMQLHHLSTRQLGEIIIAQANKVLKFTALSEQRQGITGSLFVTNFRLSFVTANTSYKLVDQSQQNALLGANDVCLINIDSLYQVSKVGVKKKKLEPGTSVPGKVKTLQVHCRDFRVFTFSFKFSLVSEDKGIANAILHHAFPLKRELLFAYEYKGKRPHEGDYNWQTSMYNTPKDFKDELERLHCVAWRVSCINYNFTCKTYPKYIVVPVTLSDSELTKAASQFPDYRLPVWSWGNRNGCVILRASGIPLLDNTYGHQIYFFIKAMKKAHPYGRDPVIMNLDDQLPNIKEILLRFLKFKEIFMPESCAQFWEQDARFLSALESSQWLQLVSSCLNIANQVAQKISSSKVSVVLKEVHGRDLTCIISSLAQMILDPHFRTISGFQSLIQKDWIAMGHQFLTRLGRLKSDEQESPVFLLFLDCVWQMVQQFPASFEYTETYLTTIWDSAHISIFDTFLFDCELERFRACDIHSNALKLRRVWDWNMQFTKQQTTLFINPLYAFAEDVAKSFQNDPLAKRQQRASLPSQFGDKEQNGQVLTNSNNFTHHPRLYRSATLWSLRVLVNNLPDVKSNLSTFIEHWPRYHILPIQSDLPLLKIWRLCYCRWMPPVQVVGGGPPTEFMEQCGMIKEIKALQRQIASLVNNTVGMSPSNLVPGLSISSINLNSSSFEETNELVTSAYPFSAGGTPWVPGISLSYFRQSSYIPSDDDLDGD